MKQKIGLLDSGIGGLTILAEIKKLLPTEDYIYYADSKNNPYGEKSEEELYIIVKKIVQLLIQKDCKLIVLACNTATTGCMSQLKLEFPTMLFVGTVPAIKVACDHEFKHTLVLATPATIASERTQELVQENKKQYQLITLLACKGLAKAIERNEQLQIQKKLYNIKLQVPKDVDSIVLGCTHYPLIKDQLQALFPTCSLLDGSSGVAKEVKRLLEKNNLLAKQKTGNVTYINSENSK